MARGQESRKRERRLRAGDEIKSIPPDLHTRLNAVKAAERYDTLWGCALRALDLGLSVMEIRGDRTGEIVNGVGFRGNS
jgi:hypothetical protein